MPAGKKLISFATIIKTVYNPDPEQSMKISIKTAIALKTKALAGGLSLLFLLGGWHKKINYFKGEIITVKDIPVSDTLTGERLLLDSINTGMLSLCDTTLFFMDIPEGIDQIQVDAKNRLLYGVNLQMEEVYRYPLPF